MKHIQQTIAYRVKQLRRERHLTLDQVAERTGVSKTMLSRIESGQSNPTIATLWKIANGFNLSFSSFLEEPDASVVEHVTIDETTPITNENGTYLIYPLFPFDPEKGYEVYATDIVPGGTHEAEGHLGEETLFMKKGTMTVTIGGNVYELHENDSLLFTSNVPHTYENTTDETVRFYSIIRYGSIRPSSHDI